MHTRTVFQANGVPQNGYIRCICEKTFAVRSMMDSKRKMTSYAKLGAHLANLKDPTTHCVLAAIGGD